MSTSAAAPASVGSHKKLQPGWESMTMMGFEPAGGCNVRVQCMAPMARLTARAMDHHDAPQTLNAASPMALAMKCPQMTLRGCEKGLSGKLKMRVLLAPNEPITKGRAVADVSHAMIAMAMAAPAHPSAICELERRGGSAAPPRSRCASLALT